MSRVLIVDDESSIQFSIRRVLSSAAVEVLSANTADEALRLYREESPEVVLLDIRLGNDDGLKVFEALRRLDPKCLVVFITGHGTSETAIEAMKRGAYDYLIKPLDASQLIAVVRQACEIRRLMCKPAIAEEAERAVDNPDLIIGHGEGMRNVFKQIGRVAPQAVNVLILGESGTGKELVARSLYFHSRRNQQPFLAINCAALTETLLESELFGHERGAFTGADRRRIGKFEQASGGTLFLDEVGDMSLNTQAKILRLLQDGTFERVGGNESLLADVRIIAATNRNLEAMIAEGRFRLDLFYRLRGVTIRLPALRERREDIPELAHYYLFRFNRDLGTSVGAIAEETVELLQSYAWPGNVRELQSVIREALIRSAGPILLPEFLPEPLGRSETATRTDSSNATWDSLADEVQAEIDLGRPGVYYRALAQFDRLVIVSALNRTGGNQAAAAELLGMSRPTLRSRMRAMRESDPGQSENG